MNRTELAQRLADRTGMTRAAARKALDGLVDVIGEALANDETVRITGFGTFVARTRAAHMARNPRTGETLSVAASTVPAFRPGKSLKAAVRAGDAS